MMWEVQWNEAQALAVLHFEQKRVARLTRQLCDAQRAMAEAEERYQRKREEVEALSRPPGGQPWQP
jgi:hypothetical protein